MSFPYTRLRRLRAHSWLRDLVSEIRLSPQDLVLPLFIREDHLEKDIALLPSIQRYTLSELPQQIREIVSLGIPAVALFPMIDTAKKDEKGSEATNPDGLIAQAIRIIRNESDKIGIITDVALDPYTSHGQDGLVENNVILNDATTERLCEQALTLAQAGAHVVAPSDMMDGRIGYIRETLEDHGFHDVAILSYTAKYASNFYGPFRHAVGSAACLGRADKKTYQMDFTRRQEGIDEALLDEQEGADMLMVKPATLYLDMICRIKEQTALPVFAYHVSGEYASLAYGAQAGALDFDQALLETMIAIKRAGAQGILTYGARRVAELLANMP